MTIVHGIGATTSMLLASYGAKVVSVSHQKINADTVTAAIKAEGGEAMGYVADATDYDQCTALLNDVVAEYGKVIQRDVFHLGF